VLCQKTLKRFLEWTYGVRGPFGPVLEMQVRTRELTGWNENEETKACFSIVSFVSFAANGR